MNWISRITLSSRIHARARIRLVDGMLEKTRPPRGGDAPSSCIPRSYPLFSDQDHVLGNFLSSISFFTLVRMA